MGSPARRVQPLPLFRVVLFLLLPAVAWGTETARLTTLMRSENLTLATLESLTEWIIRSDDRIQDAKNRQRQVEYQIEENQRKILALENRSRVRREHLRKRLVSLYKMSRGGVVRILMETPHKQELPARISAATRILRRDAEEMRLYRKELDLLAENRQHLATAKAKELALYSQLIAEQKKLYAARAQHLLLLDRLKSNRKDLQRLSGSQNQHQRALARRINRLALRLRRAGDFSKLRGELRAPVAGVLVGHFGRISDKQGVELVRHGLTYRCNPRSRVGAAADGTVRLNGPVQGYGTIVLIEHDSNYFTLYGFLSRTEVQEGQSITRGQTIGRAGRDPLTSDPAVYFELRRKDQPLDPLAWLR